MNDEGCALSGTIAPGADGISLFDVALNDVSLGRGASGGFAGLPGPRAFALLVPLADRTSQLLFRADSNNGVDASWVAAIGRR